jgi:hypothetical protein
MYEDLDTIDLLKFANRSLSGQEDRKPICERHDIYEIGKRLIAGYEKGDNSLFTPILNIISRLIAKPEDNWTDRYENLNIATSLSYLAIKAAPENSVERHAAARVMLGLAFVAFNEKHEQTSHLFAVVAGDAPDNTQDKKVALAIYEWGRDGHKGQMPVENEFLQELDNNPWYDELLATQEKTLKKETAIKNFLKSEPYRPAMPKGTPLTGKAAQPADTLAA